MRRSTIERPTILAFILGGRVIDAAPGRSLLARGGHCRDGDHPGCERDGDDPSEELPLVGHPAILKRSCEST